MNRPLCIYHGNCADGFAAAWVVRKFFQEKAFAQCDATEGHQVTVEEPEFFPGVYQQDPPDCKDRDVIIVDFSYKRPGMEKILAECKSLTWIDHHKSAIEDLSPMLATEAADSKLKFRFTIERSGAMLTWNYYFPNQEPPQLLKHIEDRDLWKFLLPGTREIQANLFSYPYDFEVWDSLMTKCNSMSELGIFHAEGEAIERKHFKDIHELINAGQRWCDISGILMPVLNVSYLMSSDVGHILSEFAANECAACYMDTRIGRIFSLRAKKGGKTDVSELAKKFGGGGHREAAGFKLAHHETHLVPIFDNVEGNTPFMGEIKV